MSFDWSKVKTASRRASERTASEASVDNHWTKTPDRFDFSSTDPVEYPPANASLLEFVTWCVPDAKTGPIAALYENVAREENTTSVFGMR